VSPLFRRNNPAAASEAAAEPDDSSAASEALGRAVTPGKGRPTPKRKESERRRRAAEPPPKDNKEARKRMRERMRAEKAEQLAGARSGEERYLLARDRGPVRRLVRDLVDARRNIGPYFFVGLLAVVVTSLQFMPPIVQLGGTVLWLGLLVLMVLDAFLLSRLIKRSVRERFPDSNERMPALYFYGILRSLSFRKIRNPKPLVKVGDEV
jgi:Protein of unknown function (DUF3043)